MKVHIKLINAIIIMKQLYKITVIWYFSSSSLPQSKAPKMNVECVKAKKKLHLKCQIFYELL